MKNSTKSPPQIALFGALAWLMISMLTSRAEPADKATAGKTNQSGADLRKQTAVLLKQTARNNDMQIALAEVGTRKVNNPQFQQYCLRLQREEMRVDDQLKPIAKHHGVSIDQSLTKNDEKELARLQNTNGKEFDRRLAAYLLSEQTKKIRNLQEVASEASAGDLKRYAEQSLPEARQERQQTEGIAKEVGVKEAKISSLLGRPPKAVGGTGDIN